jgi:hypothetical protein
MSFKKLNLFSMFTACNVQNRCIARRREHRSTVYFRVNEHRSTSANAARQGLWTLPRFLLNSYIKLPFAIAFTTALMSACGQSPSFLDVDRGASSSKNIESDVPRSSDASADEEQTIDDFGGGSSTDAGGILDQVIGKTPKPKAATGGSVDDDGTGNDVGDNDGGGSNDEGTPTDPDDYIIPGVEGDDLVAVKRCLAKWDQVPFPKTINNVRKIVAVSVGGFGNPVNDVADTAGPMLNLIYAGVNVGGTPTYNMLNKNGWYCMLVNVNVQTQLNINLHCNARLADSLVDVNVGSTMTDDTARIGVHVNSTVTINTVRPSGEECVR